MEYKEIIFSDSEIEWLKSELIGQGDLEDIKRNIQNYNDNYISIMKKIGLLEV